MALTFLDTGVLITLATGKGEQAKAAWEILEDESRTFSSNAFVKLEVLPKPVYNGHKDEAAFYERFFSEFVSVWAETTPTLLEQALDEGKKCGLDAADSIHVVAAVNTGSSELVTTEKRRKSLSRTSLVKITSIAADDAK